MSKSNLNQHHPYVAKLRKWRTPLFNFGLVCSLGLVTLAFNWTSYNQAAKDMVLVDIPPLDEVEIIRTAHDVKRTPPPPVIKPSTEIIPEDLEFNPEPEPEPVDTKIIIDEVEPKDIVVAPIISKPAPPPVVIPEETEVEVPIFIVVEEMPRFKGCEDIDGTKREKIVCADEKLLQYIYKKINYPKIAKENQIEGMVVIQFVIEKDGSISNIKIAKDIGGGCGKEAARVVKSMPDWIPGKQRNTEVRVRYNLPVRYKLQ